MVRSVIIDDEPMARESLNLLLQQYCPEVEVIGEAGDINQGVDLIRSKQPELLFLDIQLMDGTSFDILNQLEKHHYKIIFITAFEEYAINAFKFSAIDYLLKPVNPDELKMAVEKVQQFLSREQREKTWQTLLENLSNFSADQRKIVLRTNESMHIVSLHQIIRCQSEKNYTIFFLTSGIHVMVSKTLKEYEELLVPFGFIRVHQSHLVNVNHLCRYEKTEGGQLVLSDHSTIPVSVRKKEDLMKLLHGLHL